MSIELKITGTDTKEFFANAAHAFLLLAHGGNTVFAQPSAGAQGAASVPAEDLKPAPADDSGKLADLQFAVPEENPKVTAEPKQRKKVAKPALVIDNEPPADLPAKVVDEDPLGLNDVAKPAAAEQTYTLDDMRDRVKAIIEAGTKRGNEMPANVAYVRKLFAPFGIKLAAELKPEQFAEFIEASQPYLDGSAK